MKINDKVALDFDDVLLEPQYSEVSSRTHVDTGTKLGHLELKIPIISANMDSIASVLMIHAIEHLGGLGIMHRYQAHENILNAINIFKEEGLYAIPSIGTQKEDYDLAKRYFDAGADAVCVDVAHGHHKSVGQMANHCRHFVGFKTVIAGNIATLEGTRFLWENGANVVKVGVGPGKVCSTRMVTGSGVPQLSALDNAAWIKRNRQDLSVIADGGIKNSGDIVKALVFADAVMLGSLLAGTDETPGTVRADTYHTESGLPLSPQYKEYRGMASKDAQLEFRGKVNNNAPEGFSIRVDYKGPVKPIIEELVGGIRSGFSYSGAKNLKEFQEKAVFNRVNRIK